MLHLSVSINCKGIPRAKQSRTKLKRMFKMFTRCKFCGECEAETD